MKMLTAALAGLVLLFPLASHSLEIEGLYETLPVQQPTSDPDRIEVVDVFWYGCPHCNRFRPFMDKWKETAPDHVHLVRMPAVFNELYELHAHAYYTALALGIVDQIHDRIFDAIHYEKRNLTSPAAIRDFFIEQGVSGEEFDRYAKSFTVMSGLQRSLVMQQGYGIRGVPTVVVNGKFKVSAAMAGGFEKMIEVMNELIAREHAAANS